MNAGLRPRCDHRNTRGFIVVAVLWMLAALSTLVLIYLTYVTNTAVAVAGSTDRIQTDALVTAGVELTAYRLMQAKEDVRPTNGAFNARVGAARLSVTFRSEAARIDLNKASRELIAGLIVGLGDKPENAAEYTDRIVAWRTPRKAAGDDPEDISYSTAGFTYTPRHAPFPQVEELWLVRGIPPSLVERMLPFVTVFSNLASVNILDAAPQVVAALPGMTPEKLQAALSQRGDPGFDPRSLQTATGADGESGPETSKTYRIGIGVELDNGRRTAAEIVILLLEDGDEPYRIVSWRNASDGGSAPQRAASR